MRIITINKFLLHFFNVYHKLTCGLVLPGYIVKLLKYNGLSLKSIFIHTKNNEFFLYYKNYKKIKLLMNKKEIYKWLVYLKEYQCLCSQLIETDNGLLKVIIVAAKRKKKYNIKDNTLSNFNSLLQEYIEESN